MKVMLKLCRKPASRYIHLIRDTWYMKVLSVKNLRQKEVCTAYCRYYVNTTYTIIFSKYINFILIFVHRIAFVYMSHWCLHSLVNWSMINEVAKGRLFVLSIYIYFYYIPLLSQSASKRFQDEYEMILQYTKIDKKIMSLLIFNYDVYNNAKLHLCQQAFY